MSLILPVMGSTGHVYRNCKRMAITMLFQQLCREQEVGFADWEYFVGRADMFMRLLQVERVQQCLQINC